MELILVRHGNTFEDDEIPRWVGAKEDMPLTARGETQAVAVAQYLLRSGLQPAAVIAGPLLRTRQTAEIITQSLGLASPVIDRRLGEIDYGQWGGLTDSQVAAQFGEESLRDWLDRSIPPAQGNWTPSSMAIESEVRELWTEWQREFADRLIIAVSSNGRLRYFLKLVDGAWEASLQTASFKTKTGHISMLTSPDNTSPSISFWNRNPSELD